jgi:type VI secretion system protein ImpJ
MKRLQPVIWSKGTALTPQHLQSQDRFLESARQFEIEALHFCPWGLRSLQIDRQALTSGTFKVMEASGILPDGLLFDVPDSDLAPAAKNLKEVFEEDSNQVDLFLAVPEYRERGLNVSTNGSNNTRYYAETALLRDETTGLMERPVQLARKNLRIVSETELREGYSVIRIARVLRSEAGVFSLDATMVPPVLDFHAAEHLAAIARRLVEIIAAKSSQLSDQRRQKNQILAEFTASEIPNFWLLYTINSYLPLLNHLFESSASHPEQLFSAMLSLAGALTTFSRTIQPRDLPKYEHDNLSACFTDLDTKLRLLLETVVPSNFVSLALKLIQPSIYAAALAEDRFLDRTRIYLAVNADMNQGEMISKVPHLIKICSANHIEHLVRQALPGVPLTHVPTPPSSIPVKVNYKYFSLSQSGLAWEAVERARNLAAYIPGDFSNPQLELMILFPQ